MESQSVSGIWGTLGCLLNGSLSCSSAVEAMIPVDVANVVDYNSPCEGLPRFLSKLALTVSDTDSYHHSNRLLDRRVLLGASNCRPMTAVEFLGPGDSVVDYPPSMTLRFSGSLEIK